jgi:hypothetical protein
MLTASLAYAIKLFYQQAVCAATRAKNNSGSDVVSASFSHMFLYDRSCLQPCLSATILPECHVPECHVPECYVPECPKHIRGIGIHKGIGSER